MKSLREAVLETGLDIDSTYSESVLILRKESPKAIELRTGENTTKALEICNLLTDTVKMLLNMAEYSDKDVLKFVKNRIKEKQ